MILFFYVAVVLNRIISPPGCFSLKIIVSNENNLISGDIQELLESPALKQRCSRNCIISHPFSNATLGSNKPEPDGLSIISPCFPIKIFDRIFSTVIGIGGLRIDTSMTMSCSSLQVTGSNLGSSLAAFIEAFTKVLANDSVGNAYPMQPP